nr:hypothetical protein [Anaerolineae bacterium]
MLERPVRLMVIGFFLMVFGIIAPLLMVIKVIEPTLWLSFLSHTSSVVGLFIGLIGTAMFAAGKRKQHEYEQQQHRYKE